MLRWLLRSSFAVVLLVGLYCGLDHLSEPPAGWLRTYHGNGIIDQECPLDAQGRMHGKLRTFYPSGRPRSVISIWHNQPAAVPEYEDKRPDEPGEVYDE